VQLDGDRDGFVQGSECFGHFLQWGLEKVVLRDVWSAVAGNSGRLSQEQFVRCLHLMDCVKRGVPLQQALQPTAAPAAAAAAPTPAAAPAAAAPAPAPAQQQQQQLAAAAAAAAAAPAPAPGAFPVSFQPTFPAAAPAQAAPAPAQPAAPAASQPAAALPVPDIMSAHAALAPTQWTLATQFGDVSGRQPGAGRRWAPRARPCPSPAGTCAPRCCYRSVRLGQAGGRAGAARRGPRQPLAAAAAA
jgi:hypothetical protein